ncbi:MAG: hypothetical protein OFPI_37070 [Osedax symbiont Rs2]|nr:MAG: hypothetical protein OFPI_37070 [Osedax symbiont Rs2]
MCWLTPPEIDNNRLLHNSPAPTGLFFVGTEKKLQAVDQMASQ